MNNIKICQSCGMPMASHLVLGTNADGSTNQDYCKYCYGDGHFLDQVTMEEYIEMCAQYGSQSGKSKEQMRTLCKELFPTLKRWRR